MNSDLRCPSCGGSRVEVKPDLEYSELLETGFYDSFGSKDFGCCECGEGHNVRSGRFMAQCLFRMWDESLFSVVSGCPNTVASWPCLVEYCDNHYEIGFVAAREEVVEYRYKNNRDKVAFCVDREELDMKQKEEDRRDLEHRNLDQLFGVPGSYECRVCGRGLSDGRKTYCGSFCRKQAYEFQENFVWDSVRGSVLERDNYECQDCGCTENLEVDHIQAVSKGGHFHDPANLVSRCRECHKEKSRKMDDYSGSRVEESLEVFVK